MKAVNLYLVGAICNQQLCVCKGKSKHGMLE